MSAELQALQQKIKDWYDDPVAFVRECLNAEPQKWQIKALNNYIKYDKLAIKSSHGVGKSALLSWVLLHWLTTRYPAKVACTAPTSHQLFDVLWSEVRLWHARMPEPLKNQFAIKTDRIELVGAEGASFAAARTARKENPEALQGFHSENMLFLLDEASGIEEVIFEAGRGALSTEGAKVIQTGNPTRTSGYFFNSFKETSHYYNMTVSCYDSPMVSRQWIDELKAEYGEDSNVFRVRALGEFPTEDADALIPYEHIESAIDRDIVLEGIPIWGLDVARFGTDDTVLVKRYPNGFKEPPVILKKYSTTEVAGYVAREYNSCTYIDRPDAIYVDVIGIGAGVVDRLIELGLPAIGINTAEQPNIMLGEVNRLRDELWLNLAAWFAGKNVSIPKPEDGGTVDKRPLARLIEELSGIKKGFTSSGKTRVETKDDMKKRLGRSPDIADALMLTMANEGAADVLAANRPYSDWSKPIDREIPGVF